MEEHKHKPWEVGEEVTVHHADWDNTISKSRIARVLVKFVELEDGSKFYNDMFATSYPRSRDRFPVRQAHIRRPREDDERKFLEQRVRMRLDPFTRTWSEHIRKIPDAELRALAAALAAANKAAQTAAEITT